MCKDMNKNKTISTECAEDGVVQTNLDAGDMLGNVSVDLCLLPLLPESQLKY